MARFYGLAMYKLLISLIAATYNLNIPIKARGVFCTNIQDIVFLSGAVCPGGILSWTQEIKGIGHRVNIPYTG